MNQRAMSAIEFTISKDNVSVKDSYLIPRSQIFPVIKSLKSLKPDNAVLANRSTWHMAMELAVHTFLYKINYQRDRTKDIDWDYPQPLKYRIGYAVFGPICWLFI